MICILSAFFYGFINSLRISQWGGILSHYQWRGLRVLASGASNHSGRP